MQKIGFKEVALGALRIFGYTVIFGFIGFMFVPTLMGLPGALRMVLIGALILAAWMLMFMEGAARGEREFAVSETLEKHAAKGDYTPSAQELARRFNRPRSVCIAICGALPVLIAAIVLAVGAQPYAYVLQDPPAWLQAYANRPEVVGGVRYLTEGVPPATVIDYLRVFVRFMLFPYIGFVGTMSDEMSLLFDRVSPVLSLLLPLCSAIGYQFGPRRRAKYLAEIEKAKHTPRKRLKKDRQRKDPREKKQLI